LPINEIRLGHLRLQRPYAQALGQVDVGDGWLEPACKRLV
jgi:hypothetical protein